jgi:two-component system, NarL family, response regulator LiaR
MTKVAVIEDLKDYRNGIVAMLGWSEEFECVGSYESAEEAMAYLEISKPDICLCDIGLPGMSGIELVRWIRNKMPHILCMMCTAYDADEKVFEALKVGALGYILKSVAPGKIIEALTELRNGGSPMSSEIARKVLMNMSAEKTVSKQVEVEDYNITAKEKEILEQLSKGLLYKEIAAEMGISIETVKRHCYNIYIKMHVNNRTEAVNKYYKEGI